MKGIRQKRPCRNKARIAEHDLPRQVIGSPQGNLSRRSTESSHADRSHLVLLSLLHCVLYVIKGVVDVVSVIDDAAPGGEQRAGLQ